MTLPFHFNPMFMSSGSSIQFIGAGARQAGSGPFTINVHPDTQIGDVVILAMVYNNADSINTASGWSFLLDMADAGSGNTLECWGRFYNGTTPTVDVVDGAGFITFATLTFRGSISGSILVDEDATVSVDPDLGFAVVTLTGTTTLVANSFVIFIAEHALGSSSSDLFSNWANANIVGGQELFEASTTVGTDGGLACWGGIKLTAGVTGDTTVDVVGASGSNFGSACLVLQPA